jgi:hypothetical protein
VNDYILPGKKIIPHAFSRKICFNDVYSIFIYHLEMISIFIQYGDIPGRNSLYEKFYKISSDETCSARYNDFKIFYRTFLIMYSFRLEQKAYQILLAREFY